MEQNSSKGMWYLIVALVIVALALWYFYGKGATTVEAPTTEEAPLPDLSAGDTTADIASDLNETPDISADLEAAAAAAAGEIDSL